MGSSSVAGFSALERQAVQPSLSLDAFPTPPTDR
jgi:hypothetical protein